MGVYIKDMKMPRSCIACTLLKTCGAVKRWITASEAQLLTDERHKNCPMVEVPDEELNSVTESVNDAVEPTNDIIKRQDAIEAVCNGCVWYKTASCEEGKEEWECSEVNKIRHLPSAEASQNLAEPIKALKGSDLISRADAIEAIEDITWYHQNSNREMVSGANDAEHQAWYKSQDIYAALESLPSADAVQGEWIDYVGKDLGIEGQWLRDDGKTVFVQCDQCDSMFVRNLMTHMNYCPNCGAKMTKGGDSE